MAMYSRRSVRHRLFNEPFTFDFFQFVRLLRQLAEVNADDRDIQREFIRFRTMPNLINPPSMIHELEAATENAPPRMTITFMGLTGINGVLPRHYTELIYRLRREVKGEERSALHDWFDIFSHRFIQHFYRAWEHYRFVPIYERGGYESFNPDLFTIPRFSQVGHESRDPDPFTHALYSVIGLGTRGLRKRIRVFIPATEYYPAKALRSVDDLGLLAFGGALAQRCRNAWGLQTLLSGYFQVPLEVRQFRGQWLPIEEQNQTSFTEDGNCSLGQNVIAGDRIFDVQGKILIRIGPLQYDQFREFFPDREPVKERKAIFLMSQLVRFYAGPELDADVQLVLRADEVPLCELNNDPVLGPRLGWNCWTLSGPAVADAEDAVFEAEAVSMLDC